MGVGYDTGSAGMAGGLPMGYLQPPLDSGTPTINKGSLAQKGPQPPLVWWVRTGKPSGPGEPEGPTLAGHMGG
jgi:hypothetical protein